MKKLFPYILAASLLANLALSVVLIRSRNHIITPSASPAMAASATNKSADSGIAATIQANDANALLAQLKAAGVPEKTARFMAAALEFQKFSDQMAELMPSQKEYWRNQGPQTPETRLKMQQMMRGLQTKITDLLADSVPQIGANRYAYLTPERRTELRRLEKDYDDLNAEMLANAGNFRLQSDSDNLKALADERKRDIDHFLTPAEISARDLRESPTARQIRNDYGAVIDNESEYQKIYATLNAAGDDPDAQAAARAQIDATLGADRMAKLTQLNDPDYELIQAAITRLNLPAAETTAALGNIRSEAQQNSAAILADKTLSAAQRKAALQDLANKSRTQLESTLGAEGAETYANRSAWMNALKNGGSFNYDSKGKFKTKR